MIVFFFHVNAVAMVRKEGLRWITLQKSVIFSRENFFEFSQKKKKQKNRCLFQKKNIFPAQRHFFTNETNKSNFFKCQIATMFKIFIQEMHRENSLSGEKNYFGTKKLLILGTNARLVENISSFVTQPKVFRG